MPGEHLGNDTDISSLLLGVLTLVNVKCHNCGDAQVWQGNSNFVYEESGAQRGGTTCLGAQNYLLVDLGLVPVSRVCLGMFPLLLLL